jgi:tRNA pseudouridine55 synthase
VTASFLVIDKPVGLTSHDIVAIVRAVTGVQKVGHTGTLDPFATGVLPLAIGPATRLIQFLDEGLKVYDATIRLGFSTDTGDPTGREVQVAAVPAFDRARVEEVLTTFLGDRMQTPPAYSAVKVDGKPLYAYARKGVEVRAEARPIKVYSLELRDVSVDRVRVIISCSRGTYARVLAEEIAVALGTVGHLEALSRLQSGPFRLEHALTMDDLARLVADAPAQTWQEVLRRRRRGPEADAGPAVAWRPRDAVWSLLKPHLRRPVGALSHLPRVEAPPAVAERVRRGAKPPGPPASCPVGGRYLVVCGDDVIAVAEAGSDGGSALRVVDAT